MRRTSQSFCTPVEVCNTTVIALLPRQTENWRTSTCSQRAECRIAICHMSLNSFSAYMKIESAACCDLSAHVHVRSTRTSDDDAGIGSPFWSTGHPECGQMWNASCRSSAVVTAPGDNNNAKFLSVVHFVGHLAKCGLTARPSVISLHHGADPLGTAPQGKMNIGCVSFGPTYSMIPAFAHLAKIGHNAV
jgi:hypothetical protein